MSFKLAKYEVADLFRQYRSQLGHLSKHQNKVIDAIVNCRTAALGGHVYQCNNSECGNEEQSYNSCRNRNCNKCQYSAKELWVEKRVKELLPIPYFHMVFTVPHCFNELMMYNRVKIFALLFQSSQLAVKKLMKTKYQANPGIISLLHTWGSNLSFHVHTHMLVTGGGIKLDGERWVPSRESYCLPIKALSPVYRAEFIKGLRKLHSQKKLNLPPTLRAPFEFENLVESSFKENWVVYAKKPFSAPINVLKYLGNYTHRIAFSNHRILKVEGDRVYFNYKDYKDGGYEKKITSLAAPEFLRRYLMHVVPKRFVKIRFYGFMAHKSRTRNIERARVLIAQDSRLKKMDAEELKEVIADYKETHSVTSDQCRKCKAGLMVEIQEIPGTQSWSPPPAAPDST